MNKKVAILCFVFIASFCYPDETTDLRSVYNLPVKVGMTKTEILNACGEHELFNRIIGDVKIPGIEYPPESLPFDSAEWITLSYKKQILFHKNKSIIILLLENKVYQLMLINPSNEDVYGVKLGDKRDIVERKIGMPIQELNAIINVDNKVNTQVAGKWLSYRMGDNHVMFYINNDGMVDVISISFPLEKIKEMLNISYREDIECIRNQLPGKNNQNAKEDVEKQSVKDETNYKDTIVLDNGIEVNGEIIEQTDCNYRIQIKTGSTQWHTFSVIKEVRSDDDWKVENFKKYQELQKTIPKPPSTVKAENSEKSMQKEETDNKKAKNNKRKELLSNRHVDHSSGGSSKRKTSNATKIGKNPFILGMGYYNNNKHEKAIEEFKKAIEKGVTGSSLAYYYLGMSLCKTGKYSEAIDVFSKSTKGISGSPELHYCLGEIHYAKGDYQKAEEEWRLAMNPGIINITGDTEICETALKRLIEYYNKIGEVDKAVNLLEEKYQLGLGISSDQLSILKNKLKDIDISLRRKDYESAKKYIDEALDIAPNHYLVHYNLAYIYYATNKIQDAQRELEITCKLNREFTNPHLLYAMIYAERGDIRQALDKVKQAKDIDPSDPMIYYYSGEIYSLVEDTSNAIQNYKRYLDLIGDTDFSSRLTVEGKLKKLEAGT